jgi:hypothetical protein
MTEQEMNRHFQAIRTFIEHSMEMHANPRQTTATATAVWPGLAQVSKVSHCPNLSPGFQRHN